MGKGGRKGGKGGKGKGKGRREGQAVVGLEDGFPLVVFFRVDEAGVQ